MKKLIYIGNNLVARTKYTPMLVTLSELLKKEGYSLAIASSYMNKVLRLLDMIRTVLQHGSSRNILLLDTFGASNFYYAVLISQLARLLRMPYIPILRGGNLPDRFRDNPYYTRILFSNSLYNITPSDYLKVALADHGYDAITIPNIINIEDYQFKKRLDLQPKLLYVRAFHEIYNPTMAVRVLHLVKREFPKATLCMIGPAKDQSFEDTKRMAEELGVSDSITYTGVLPKTEWHELSTDYDIFINTTTIDNTPVSVMEAMAMGLPVVSTNVGGIPYLLEHGIDAFLVPNDDAEAMSAAICSILNKEVDVDSMVNNARKKVEGFDWAYVGPMWNDLLMSTQSKPRWGWIDRIYQKSPVFIQNLMISVYGFYWKNRRFGGRFKEYVAQFEDLEDQTLDQWQHYQEKQLRALLVHAYRNVPYYRKSFGMAGLTEQDLEKFTLKDMDRLPYLEKDDLRKYGESTLLAENRNKGTFYLSSGSTGTPTSIYFSKDFHQKWNALYELRVRNWAGVDQNMRRAMIGGRRIIPDAQMKAPYYRYNFAEKQAYFSAYHISEKTTPDYVTGLRKLKTDYLVGYAISIYLLAENILKLGLDAPRLKAVLTSSEKLSADMRETIGKAFQCVVYDAYSGVEACGLISENEHGELILSPEAGIMEVLDPSGNPVRPGEVGEVVASGLLNFDQPLIRYRIGDSVRLATSQETKGRLKATVVAEIEGRVEDVIIGAEGQKMVRFHGIFIGIQGLVMAQVIQESLQEIIIRLIVDDSYTENAEAIMRSRLESQLGAMDLRFDYVSEIPKTRNGKFKAVISKIVP